MEWSSHHPIARRSHRWERALLTRIQIELSAYWFYDTFLTALFATLTSQPMQAVWLPNLQHPRAQTADDTRALILPAALGAYLVRQQRHR